MEENTWANIADNDLKAWLSLDYLFELCRIVCQKYQIFTQRINYYYLFIMFDRIKYLHDLVHCICMKRHTPWFIQRISCYYLSILAYLVETHFAAVGLWQCLTRNDFKQKHEFESIAKIVLDVVDGGASLPQMAVTPSSECLQIEMK